MALKGSFAGHIVIDNRALQQVLNGQSGPVAKALLAAGDIVKAGARRRVGVYKPAAGDPRPAARKRKPGTLRDSIVKRLVVGGPEGVKVLVGSEDPIALFHHEGTVAHPIPAKKPIARGRNKGRKLLVFYWPKVGRVVAFPAVKHPGTQPNRYLSDSLQDLRARF
jgi:hypothetical protein